MNQHSHLSSLGQMLIDSLRRIEVHETEILVRRERETIHVPTVGNTISTAYEQLRNASEYAESDLLQQRAIRRYLRRVLSFHAKSSTLHLADELVAELTQAEYLSNDHTTKADVKIIAGHIKRYYGSYWKFADSEDDMDRRYDFQQWTLDVLAVRCEQALQSNQRQLLFARFAHSVLHDKLKTKKIIKNDEKFDNQDLSLILYISIHRSLLKSDNASIRTALVDSYQQDADIVQFELFNQRLDYLFDAKTTVHMTRIISKNGAALRFIYSGFFSKDAPLTMSSLKSPEALVQNLHRHIENEYDALDKRLNIGIIRSIIFLLITKGVIGFAIELPYDLFTNGRLILTPFLVNLLFPAVFIAFSRLTLTSPIDRNTSAVMHQVSELLFGDPKNIRAIRMQKETSSVGFNTIYTVIFIVVFAALSYILYAINFNIVQGFIFFIFLSTATFLSFRLSRQIHELEVVNTSQGSLSLLRDIIYMPFIYVGQQISYRYSQVNIVATVLDILIELPLKTILRLIRQWTQFLNDKRDELI